MSTNPARRILNAINTSPWLIQPDALEGIIAIAERNHGGIEAVEARRGERLQRTWTVTIRGDGVAVIPITGPIIRYASMFTRVSGGVSVEDLAMDFNAALENPNVNSILFEIDSPGGAAAGIQEFADMVYKARGKKPIMAYAGGICASAAYWIGSAADELVIAPTGIAGSIGVVLMMDEGPEEGTVQFVSRKAPNKRPDLRTDEGKAQIQSLVDTLGDLFIDAVARNRGVTAEKVESDFGQGGLFVGKEAVSAGLVDRLGSMEELIAEMSAVKGRKSKVTGEMNSMPTENQPEQTQTPAITAEFIQANHPAVAEQFRKEGATAEMNRIKDVEAHALPGHTELINQLKFDGKTTGPEAAMAVLQAEKKNQASALQTFQNEAPQPAAPAAEAPASKPKVDPNLPVEERCKAEWDSNPEVRDEFATVEAFTAFKKAEESGRARIFKK